MSSARGAASVFGYIGRRLALLNAGLVVLLIAAVGVAILLFARYTLLEQADDALVNQADAFGLQWAESLEHDLPIRDEQREEQGGDEDHDEDEEDVEELIESGDVIALGFDRDGNIVANPRRVNIPGLWDGDSVVRALAGEASFDSSTYGDGHQVRIYTAPVRSDGQIVGAVQVQRSTD
ncbi:MAG: hypothetical protein M3Y37_08485, partial [Chloroflexota bacterium]|nr:hypothetical protein [Chloroflexota bacterium]